METNIADRFGQLLEQVKNGSDYINTTTELMDKNQTFLQIFKDGNNIWCIVRRDDLRMAIWNPIKLQVWDDYSTVISEGAQAQINLPNYIWEQLI